MVSRVGNFSGAPVLYVPERIVAVPRFDRDEPALRASRAGFESGSAQPLLMPGQAGRQLSAANLDAPAQSASAPPTFAFSPISSFTPDASAASSSPLASSVSSPAVERAFAQATLSHGNSELSAPTASSDRSWAQQMPTVAASGSFLSNRGSDPLGVGPYLDAQRGAHSDAESAALASAEALVDHKIAMNIIENIGRA